MMRGKLRLLPLALTVFAFLTPEASAQLLIDFNSTTQGGGPNHQVEYQAYNAGHEVAADFDTKTYTALFNGVEATVSITPAWPNTTDNRVQQMIDRGDGNDANWLGTDIDLITDFLGIDSRPGNGGNGDWDRTELTTPTYMTLTLEGLPPGDYQWLSLHHDTEHCWSDFQVEVSTDGGVTYTDPPFVMEATDSTTGGNPASLQVYTGGVDPDPRNLPSTFTTTFTASGADDVVFRFAPFADGMDGTGVHKSIWGINGFELESTDISTVCPHSLGTEPDGANVTLTWQNGDTVPTSVRVVRNGTELAAAATADPPTYTDTAPPPGILNYELTFDVPGEQCLPLTRTYDACMSALSAELQEDGVKLTWTNSLTYPGITITRDDGAGAVELEASYQGDAEEYLDENPPIQGTVTYMVEPTNGSCEPAAAAVNLDCELPAPVCEPGEPALLTNAFAFGSRVLDCELHSEPGEVYDLVWQGAPLDLQYEPGRGWGYEALYLDFFTDTLTPYGDRLGYEIFGPFDDSPNGRTAFPTDTCPEELYDSFIGGKNFLQVCDELAVGDPDSPCIEAPLPPDGIIFRIDLDNGAYRFVAAVGGPTDTDAHRILAEDGGDGPAGGYKETHVVLVSNFDQARFAVGETTAATPGEGVYARVGFDDKIPPPGDGVPPSPQFINMDENGMASADCANSPTLNVTQGYIRIHQLQANSNDGCGGPRDPNGGNMVILEIWKVDEVVVGELFKRGDSNRDGSVNIADAVYILQNLFAQGPAILCPDSADSNDDEALNIADAVYILQNLFAQGPPIPAPGPDVCGPDPTPSPGGGQDLPACDYCPGACEAPPVACPPAQ